MNKEITASYVWTVDELIKASEHHQRDQCRKGFRAGLVFISLMAIFSGWCSYHEQGWSLPAVLFPLVGVYILFLRKYDIRWGIRMHFKKRPDSGAHVVWILGEDSLQINTGESESKMNWSQISKVRKAMNGFLLYSNDMMFHWLPVTALESEDDRTRAEELLRRKIKDFAEIR